MFLKFIAGIAKRGRGTATQLDGVLSAVRMRRILDCERARTDRGGAGFALLKFDATEVANHEELLAALGRICKTRLRATDDVGWLSHLQLGVLLPCTPLVGARRVADDVCAALGAIAALGCEIYCYPPDAADDPDDAQTSLQADRRAEATSSVLSGGTVEDRPMLVASEGGLLNPTR